MSLRRLAQVAVQPVVALSSRAPTRRMAHRLDSLRPPYRAFANEIPGMKDEYGDLDDSGHSFILDEDFHLEAGGILRRAEVRYQTWGTLNATKDNCLVVCHALTGNQSLDTWWGECLGPGKAFDTNKYFVVCANVLGSCYGTTGPMSIDHSAPSGNKRYGSDFPAVSIRDTVRLHMRMLSEGLGVKSVESVVGGSMGGMQALEWLLLGGPEFVRSGVAIACGAQHTAWQIAISETQREAIRSNPEDPQAGLSVARMIAMVSYRTAQAYDRKFGRSATKPSDLWGPFQVRSYLEHQGRKFNHRFDPQSYISITEQMDSHDVGRGRGGVQNALESIDPTLQPTLIVGIDSDVLYPLSQQEELHRLLVGSEMSIINSMEGHDGFLLEVDQVSNATTDFLNRVREHHQQRQQHSA